MHRGAKWPNNLIWGQKPHWLCDKNKTAAAHFTNTLSSAHIVAEHICNQASCQNNADTRWWLQFRQWKVENSSSLKSPGRLFSHRDALAERTEVYKVSGGRIAAIKFWHRKSSRVTGSVLKYHLTENTWVQTPVRGSVKVKTQLNRHAELHINLQQHQNLKSNCKTSLYSFESERVIKKKFVYRYKKYTL